MSSDRSRNRIVEEREDLGLLGVHRRGTPVQKKRPEIRTAPVQAPKVSLRTSAPRTRLTSGFPEI